MTYRTRRNSPGALARLGFCLILALLPALGAFAAADAGPAKAFNIPAGSAEQTLRQFSAQSDVELAFPTDQVQGVQTNAVHGDLPPADALQTMLAGTSLVVVKDSKNGAFAVRRETAEEKRRRPAPAKPGSGP